MDVSATGTEVDVEYAKVSASIRALVMYSIKASIPSICVSSQVMG